MEAFFFSKLVRKILVVLSEILLLCFPHSPSLWLGHGREEMVLVKTQWMGSATSCKSLS